MRYHAKESVTASGVQWVLESQETSLQATNMILVRIMIGKVQNPTRLDSIFRQVPVRGDTPYWNCVEWLKEALVLTARDGKALGSSVVAWDSVRGAAMEYCNRKKDEGRFQVRLDPQRVPTYDLLEHREVTP